MGEASQGPSWDEMDESSKANHVRALVESLRRVMGQLEDLPPATGVTKRIRPGSRPPVNIEAVSWLTELRSDLAFWVHALFDEFPELTDPKAPVDLSSVGVSLAILRGAAPQISRWDYGRRLAYELEDHAKDGRRLTRRDDETYTLGACPNTIGVDGERVECGRSIRVSRVTPSSEIRCHGCGLVDTVDGWLLRMIGTEKPLTAKQLVPLIHARLGVRISSGTITRWKERHGLIPVGQDEKGADLFDRRDAFAMITLRDVRRSG